MISSEDAQPKCFSTSSAVPAGFFVPKIMNLKTVLISYQVKQSYKTKRIRVDTSNLLCLNTLIPVSASNALAFESS